MVRSGRAWRMARLVVGALALLSWAAPPVAGQTSANTGAFSLTGSLDGSSAYFRRGIPQDDTGLMLWPAVDAGVALSPRLTVNVGSWNSLHTGDRGRNGPSGRLWYASEFHGSVAYSVGAMQVGAIYTAFTSPNSAFGSVEELAVRVSHAGWTRPYVLLSFELEGQLDGGLERGRYLEVGAAPAFGTGLRLTVPVKAGFSLGQYYEGLSGDERFGFLSIGGQLAKDLTGGSSRFGRWNIHGGVEYVMLGDRNELQFGSASTVIGSAGIGFSY